MMGDLHERGVARGSVQEVKCLKSLVRDRSVPERVVVGRCRDKAVRSNLDERRGSGKFTQFDPTQEGFS